MKLFLVLCVGALLLGAAPHAAAATCDTNNGAGCDLTVVGAEARTSPEFHGDIWWCNLEGECRHNPVK